MNKTDNRNCPDLEETCKFCDGKGGWRVEDTGGWHRCKVCSGAGYIPTEFGEKILALMRHNFKPMFQDVTHSD